MHKLAKARGFEFVSKTFSKTTKKHLWRCQNRHQWPATPNRIQQGDGCPYCHTFVSEEKCRYILESLTGFKFVKTRKALEGQLELDGYCDDLRMAFEYQGIQHYKIVKYWHNDHEFKSLQQRDAKKRKICKEKNILLIEIPYTMNKNNHQLTKYVRKKVPAELKIKGKRINWRKFGIKTKMEEIKEALATRNITCSNKFYVDHLSPLKLHCNVCGHDWTSTAGRVQRKRGCPKCAGNLKLTTEHVIKICASKNIKFLDPKYKNIRTCHNFRCLICGHKWKTTFQCVQRMECCPKCSTKKAVKKRKEYGKESHKKMWITLRKKYGPTGRRKPRLSEEERKKRRKEVLHRYKDKKREKRRRNNL